MIVRPAKEADAHGMSAVLAEIVTRWGSDRPSGPEHVLETYIASPDRIACSVAETDDGKICGFQSLILARPGNRYEAPVGWGVIGTYVDPASAGTGIGRALFRATEMAAQGEELEWIDATIGDWNHEGLAYYEAMGFETYESGHGRERKRFPVAVR